MTRDEAIQAIENWLLTTTGQSVEGFGEHILDAIGFDKMQYELSWWTQNLKLKLPPDIRVGQALVGRRLVWDS